MKTLIATSLTALLLTACDPAQMARELTAAPCPTHGCGPDPQPIERLTQEAPQTHNAAQGPTDLNAPHDDGCRLPVPNPEFQMAGE